MLTNSKLKVLLRISFQKLFCDNLSCVHTFVELKNCLNDYLRK